MRKSVKLEKFVRQEYARWINDNLMTSNGVFIKMLEENYGFRLNYTELLILTENYQIIDEQKFLIFTLRDLN